MPIDWNALRITCTSCKSYNTTRTKYYKMAINKKGIKKEMIKYICNECGHEFWI